MANIESSVRYAETGSPGIFADQIGWFDYSPFSPSTPFSNNATYSVINTISQPPGYTISFNMTISQTYPFGYIPIAPFKTPVYPFSVFGNTAYIGIDGNIDLYMLDNAFALASTLITLDNIKVVDSLNTPITNYDIIAADGESTNSDESWSVTTNGTPWSIVQILPPVIENGTKIDITGEGTNTIKYTGTTLADPPTIIVSTNAPTKIVAQLDTLNGKQGSLFGIMIPSTSFTDGGNSNFSCCC